MSESSGKVQQSPSLKARALRLLSLREYSRKGLAAKLQESEARRLKLNTSNPTGDDEITVKPTSLQIEEVLNDFEARGWLSDERFAESLVRRRQERYGTRKIQEELQRAGVDAVKATELIQGLKDSEFERARELWVRKFGVVTQDQKERARQYRFLASKGFAIEIVSKIVGGRGD